MAGEAEQLVGISGCCGARNWRICCRGSASLLQLLQWDEAVAAAAFPEALIGQRRCAFGRCSGARELLLGPAGGGRKGGLDWNEDRVCGRCGGRRAPRIVSGWGRSGGAGSRVVKVAESLGRRDEEELGGGGVGLVRRVVGRAGTVPGAVCAVWGGLGRGGVGWGAVGRWGGPCLLHGAGSSYALLPIASWPCVRLVVHTWTPCFDTNALIPSTP